MQNPFTESTYINTIYALTISQFYILFKILHKFTMQYGLTVLQ